jgi:predicted Zn-dependent peptidase
VPIALDVLSDLVLNPTFADTDIERERGVIFEEIKIDEDNPDVLVHEIFTQNFWKDQPLGKPILGTTKTVSGLGRLRFSTTTRSASAREHGLFGGWSIWITISLSSRSRRSSTLAPGTTEMNFQSAQVSAPIILRNKRSLEQVQICLGVPSPPITDENRYATLILNTVLGGGMSSRLFQTIREERGMAYSIYSDLSPYSDTGSLCVYAGTSADKTLEMLDLVMAEFSALKETLLTAEELHRAKEQVKGNILLGLESSGSRMSNLARQEMYFHHFFSVEEVLDRLDAVTADRCSGWRRSSLFPSGLRWMD